ncbi:hypothetical protein GOP47_0007702 [Adiantum capillus-veneris]|uniref:Uncharacterized protein n=1 Tax=Adiantum capillus-veneris TaxID=13818 RepID=A0A9D4V1D9_ADICA|nr:hypothetical protein GOP47_0007702 [Adiantum capillus-veneris]
MDAGRAIGTRIRSEELPIKFQFTRLDATYRFCEFYFPQFHSDWSESAVKCKRAFNEEDAMCIRIILLWPVGKRGSSLELLYAAQCIPILLAL